MGDLSNNDQSNDQTSDHSALTGLATLEQMQLLDLMNKLRDLGVSGEVDLPQIIVVGAQSSGKSSVLEAISHIPFPRGDTLCTTFATEVTLIRGEDHAIRVKIRPHPSSDADRSEYLQGFGIECSDINEVAKVITAAKTHLLAYEETSDDSFLEDTLCVEYSHSQFPPLTLVDLPGLIKVPNENQTDDDVEVVKSLVHDYMKNPKSIILAIVSAQSDMSEHSILGMVRELDPGGHRTLGIITKPDTLSRGSPLEQNFLRLANNQNTQWHFDLGWHVVRNRTYEERKLTPDDRDQIEMEWFANGIWENTVNSDHVGAQSLRRTLASLLERHTRRFLPEVVSSIRDLLVKCEQDLAKLGESRETPREQRDYLISKSQAFYRLVHLSTEGLYQESFFTLDEHPCRRIRARVQTLNKAFASVMHTYGHSLGTSKPPRQDQQHIPIAYTAAAKQTRTNDRESYLEKISTVLRTSSGRELPGMVNPDVLREIFVLKMAKWKDIAQAHLDEVWMTIKKALILVAEHCCTSETSQRILRHVISDSLERKREKMATKLQELLLPHQKYSPITYDPAFEDNLEDSSDSGEEDEEDEGDEEEEDNEDDQQRTEVRVLRYVETYYKTALRTFIDNVAVLVVEMCLIDGLDSSFSPSVVSRMTDGEVAQLADESPSVKSQRTQLLEKKSKLENALRQCLINGEQSPEETNERTFSVSSPTIFAEENSSDQPDQQEIASHHNSRSIKALKSVSKSSTGQKYNSSGSDAVTKSIFDSLPSRQIKQGFLFSGDGMPQGSKQPQQRGLFGAPAAQESNQPQQPTFSWSQPVQKPTYRRSNQETEDSSGFGGFGQPKQSTGLLGSQSVTTGGLFAKQSTPTGGLFGSKPAAQPESKPKNGRLSN